ncbi:hypothetical protein P8452_33417 [Trifolium repens]|nr:hypothetical protein P8452_33417 [Trifolium repens]
MHLSLYLSIYHYYYIKYCKRWRDEISNKGSNDGGSEMAAVVGLSDDGSGDGWSDDGRVRLGEGCRMTGQGHVGSRREEADLGRDVSVTNPTLLGNFSNKVNKGGFDTLGVCEKPRFDGDLTNKVQGRWDIVPVHSFVARDLGDGVQQLLGSKEAGGSVQSGPGSGRPSVLRTNKGDFPLAVCRGGVDSNSVFMGQVNNATCSPADSIETHSVSFSSKEVGATVHLDVGIANLSDRGDVIKNNRKHPKFHHYGSKFLNFQRYIQRKGERMKKKKLARKDQRNAKAHIPVDSDPIQCSCGRDEEGGRRTEENPMGISLEVVLPCGGAANGFYPSTVSSLVAVDEGFEGGGARNHQNVVVSNRASVTSTDGGEEDRRRSQAHHVIDILEDVGMNFIGDVEANVQRLMEFEVRDGRELVAWEQGQTHQ